MLNDNPSAAIPVQLLEICLQIDFLNEMVCANWANKNTKKAFKVLLQPSITKYAMKVICKNPRTFAYAKFVTLLKKL